MKRPVVVISSIVFLTLICNTGAKSQENIPPPSAQELHSSLTGATANTCPADMVEITGDFCPEVVQNCTNLDRSVHNVNGYVRCLEYAATQCLSKKTIPMHFCIDKYEWPNKEGEKPAIMVTWFDMKRNCEDNGKRICVDHEWSMACEGEDIKPYPYGYKRDATACNIDHPQKPWFDASKTNMTMEIALKLDQRVPSGSMEGCVSDYGVHDMTGNVDEWVVNSSGSPYVSGLMGGHWVKGARNRCRPETLAHGPIFEYYAAGGRCCKSL